MATINPYLNFQDNTEEAFNFYRSVFGGEFAGVVRFKDMPGLGDIPAAEANKIMHIALPIGKSNVLMGTDMLASKGQHLERGNNHSLSLEADSKPEAEKLYSALSVGGTIEMPIGDSPWGSYFGMFTDKFGIRWMVNYTYPKN